MELRDADFAIRCHVGWGPVFGQGSDLSICDNCDLHKSGGYFPCSYNSIRVNFPANKDTTYYFSGA